MGRAGGSSQCNAPTTIPNWSNTGEGLSGNGTSLHPFFLHLLRRCWTKLLFHGPEHPFHKDTAARKDEGKVLIKEGTRGANKKVYGRASPYLFPLFTPSLITTGSTHQPPASPSQVPSLHVGQSTHASIFHAWPWDILLAAEHGSTKVRPLGFTHSVLHLTPLPAQKTRAGDAGLNPVSVWSASYTAHPT